MISVGEIFSIFILVIAAVETAIALCLILAYYRITNNNYSNIEHRGEDIFSAIVLTIGITTIYNHYCIWNILFFFLYFSTQCSDCVVSELLEAYREWYYNNEFQYDPEVRQLLIDYYHPVIRDFFLKPKSAKLDAWVAYDLKYAKNIYNFLVCCGAL